MKFTLAKSDRYWWPCIVRVPHPEKPGQIIEQTLLVLFEPMDQDAALAEQVRIADLTDLTERVMAERQSLAAVCKDWKDVLDDTGQPVPFSAEVLDQALRKSWFRLGLYKGFADSLAGEAARLGN